MKTATYSNGHTDTYNGHRAVTVGWAVIDNETNETVRSGHSLDARRASKTAAPSWYPGSIYPCKSALSLFGQIKELKDAGYSKAGPGNATYLVRQHNEKVRAEYWSRHRIEIVAL